MSANILILVIVCLSSTLMGLVVYLKNRREVISRSFGAFVVAMNLWLVANQFSNESTIPISTARLINDCTLALPVLSILFLGYFVSLLTVPQAKLPSWTSRVFGLVSALFVVLSFTPLLVRDIVYQEGTYLLQFGPLIGVYFGYMIVAIGLITLQLIRAIIHSRGRDRVRLYYIVVFLAFGLTMAMVSNLILPLFAKNYSLVGYGPLSALVITIGFAYTIITQRLFDIRAVVARSVAYVLSLGVLAALYGGLLVLVSSLFFPGQSTSWGQAVANLFLAIVLAATFPFLKQLFERITQTVFYRDHYDTQEVIDAVGKELVSELDLDRLLHSTLEIICSMVHIRHGQLYIFNSGRIYKVAHFGPLPQRIPVVPELKLLRKTQLVVDEIHGGEVKRMMEDHGIRVSQHLRTRDEFVGFLLLGDKLSGDIYTEQDAKLVGILASSLAVAVQNAKAYAEIAQFNLTLQDKVAQATKRLRKANANLKSLDEAKDEFISMASHQLRTPLTTIKGYLSMILEGDTGKITTQQTEFLNYAFQGSERMVGLISDLLNVSRLAAGRFMIERAATDIVAVAADEVRQLQTHAEAKKLKLEFVVPKASMPTLYIDENKTRQVMMNFIDNALYYTKQGSVRVTLEKTKTTVRFLVRDTGIGVPKGAQSKLFSKFYRAENAQVARPDGTGLGLYLAKRVVGDQGGKIIFASTEGKGSTFGFEMPIAPPIPEVKPGDPKVASDLPVKA
jgi:signal transduction histidine kinase